MHAEQTAKPRIVVADDNADILKVICRILRPEFDVVGIAQDGKEAFTMAVGLKPDVLLLDVAMPELDGLEVAIFLKPKNLGTKLIFLAALEHADLIQAALRVGAHGFVFKSQMQADLGRAIREVLAGRTFYSSGKKQ